MPGLPGSRRITLLLTVKCCTCQANHKLQETWAVKHEHDALKNSSFDQRFYLNSKNYLNEGWKASHGSEALYVWFVWRVWCGLEGLEGLVLYGLEDLVWFGLAWKVGIVWFGRFSMVWKV